VGQPNDGQPNDGQPNDGRAAMSGRSYLSIGDVLTLLRQEFPDVTISKIRFLESQGLVNPERTPSGYRKFYEHDVERLRWVLRQQREHFLPLKVIKDRLDEDATGNGNGTPSTAVAKGSRATAASPDVPADPDAEAPVVAEPAAADVGVDPVAAADPAAVPEPAVAASTPQPAPVAEPVLVGQRAASSAAVSGSSPVDADTAGLPGIEPGSSHTAPTSVERAHRASLATPHTRAADPAPPANGSGNGSGHTAPARASSPPGKPPRPPRGTAAAGSAAAAPTRAAATARSTDAESDGPRSAAVGAMGGASLSLEELVAASGLSEEYVRQLEEFHLIRATTVGGAPYYDEEALTVANVAAKFAAFGIEARHLRLYKNAADREAGFIEQIVIPMVRQRNPEARARANQTADDLSVLGQQLKGSLLRSALRDLLNG
jgi:DNA-binding transcriptional MerR regulator